MRIEDYFTTGARRVSNSASGDQSPISFVDESSMSTHGSISSVEPEGLPGLSKIEYIEYLWLTKRTGLNDPRQLARLSELEEKHFSALAEKVFSPAADADVVKIGDLIVRYTDQSPGLSKPNRWTKVRGLFDTLKLISRLKR